MKKFFLMQLLILAMATFVFSSIQKAYSETFSKNNSLAILASKQIVKEDINSINLDKSVLYEEALKATDSLSNPVILMLINDKKAVQDNKQYADAIPKTNMQNWRSEERFITLSCKAAEEIKAYGYITNATVEKMKQLVNEYYILPVGGLSEQQKVILNEKLVNYKNLPIKNKVPNEYLDAANHIVINWANLIRKTPEKTKSSLIPLPNPYVVPGGRFDEIYYWDSYFTILGLKESGYNKLTKDMVENFMYMVDKFGFIPNGNRIYYLTRSQPPFLTQMIDEIAPSEKELSENNESRLWLEKAYNTAVKEYTNNWMKSPYYVSGYGLNRYYDSKNIKRIESYGTDNQETINSKEFFQHERSEAESGWDFSDRFDNRCSDFLAVDLNSILYKNEKTFEKWAKMLGKNEESQKWAKLAEKRKRNMYKYLWNENIEFFSDFDIKNRKKSDYKSLASAFPLWAELATYEQANKVRNILVRDFEFNGGLVTSLKAPNIDKQWNYPNGWAPLEYISIKGLENYGFLKDVRRITKKWMDLNTKIYKEKGKFIEKYNVVENNDETGGTYPLQDGFGWTNGIYLYLLNNVVAKY